MHQCWLQLSQWGKTAYLQSKIPAACIWRPMSFLRGMFLAAYILGLCMTLLGQNYHGGTRKIPKTHIGPSLSGLCSYRAQRKLGGWAWVAAVSWTTGKQKISQRCFFRSRVCHTPGNVSLARIIKEEWVKLEWSHCFPTCQIIVSQARKTPQGYTFRCVFWDKTGSSLSFFQKCRKKVWFTAFPCIDSLSQSSGVLLCWAALPGWPRDAHLSEEPGLVRQELGLGEKCMVKLMQDLRLGDGARRSRCQAVRSRHRHEELKTETEPKPKKSPGTVAMAGRGLGKPT